MLKNNKLLYILPEMAFTAGVGETPKEDYYFVQTFHQINGEFMRDENFIHESLKKLFERVEEGTYTLVLPDFLFTDTIVNVPETEDVKIAQYLRDQLLPRIEVSTFSHETRTSVLLQRKTTSKVQLSAFEKELAASLKLAIGSRNVVLDEIVPLSWVLKAAVSLEPSLTIAQVGERLYLAEHYIGINQTISTPIDDLDVLAESVRTLKGSDPNLQTTYLFTSELVEEKLKKFLLKTLPVQQLTEPIEEEAKIPPYVKQIIEVSARTLSLPDFAVPRFSIKGDDLLGQVAPAPVEEKIEASVEEIGATPESVEPAESEPEEETETEAAATAVAHSFDLEAKAEEKAPEPSISEPVAAPEETAEVASDVAPAVEEKSEPAVSEDHQPEPEKTEGTGAVLADDKSAVTAEKSDTAGEVLPKTVPEKPAASEAVDTENKVEKTVEPEKTVEAEPAKVEEKPAAAPAMPKLSFMGGKSDDAATSAVSAETAQLDKTAAKNDKNDDTISKNKKLVSKKKGSMSSFVKKLFLFLLIFVVVIALGIGVGVLILSMSGKDLFKTDDLPEPEMSALPTPVPEVTPAPVVEATPEPEVEEEIDPAEFDLLVVNATSVGGLAGKAKTSLEAAGFSGVQTGNAAGTYEEEGTFVLMKTKNTALIKALEEATDRTMTFDEDIKVEDAAGRYDAVIVLNEE